MNKLGEKIKKARKELKLTQSELAGGEMTNSMLSQIENGVSQPSMKTLQYLAGRLKKPVSYFLDDEAGNVNIKYNLTNVSSEYNDRLNSINSLIDNGNPEQAAIELEGLTASAPGITLSKSAADIVFKLGYNLCKTGGLAKGERYLRLAADSFNASEHYIDAAKTLLELGRFYFSAQGYRECERIMNSVFEENDKAIVKDYRFEIEMYYSKIMFLSAVGRMDEIPCLLDTALSLSERTGFYFKSDELYRLKAAVAYMESDKQKFEENITQALKFAEFNQNKASLANIHLAIALEAADSGDMPKAMNHTGLSAVYFGQTLYLHHILEARALLFQGDYGKAYETLLLVKDPGFIRYKLDYHIFWSHKTYLGLTLHKLGRSEEGIREIEQGISKMEESGNSRYLADAWRTLGEIFSDCRLFEEAYTALKKADTIGNDLQKLNRII